MDKSVLDQRNLDLNSILEEYDSADNSTAGDLPSDFNPGVLQNFNWNLFYLIVVAFIFIAIIIAVARIRNKTTRMIWMKNLMLQGFQVLSPTYQESQTFNPESQTLNQESQTPIRNL